jgi:ABC-2 type transport system permease protein
VCHRKQEAAMQREGSPWQGLGVVISKELADQVTSIRMFVLELLVVLVAIVTVSFATEQVKQTTAEDPFLLLRLFTTSQDPIPSFFTFLSLLLPLIAIALGFDSVNSEHSRRTLSRILAQPIYRDALLFGKFIAGLITISISLVVLWLLVIGLGLLQLGVPPSFDEVARAFIFLLVAIAYAGVWLALALLFSIVFRSAATAALVTLGLWFLFTLIWPLIAPRIALSLVQSDDLNTLVFAAQTAARLSPVTLFNEASSLILDPSARTLGPIYLYLPQLQGAVLGAPLPIDQSLLIVWPQIVGLIAGSILLFVIGYIVFQRQEVRA